jgi:hypothetical protein
LKGRGARSTTEAKTFDEIDLQTLAGKLSEKIKVEVI